MIRVRRIDAADPLYAQALALREEEILRPIGMDLPAFHAAFPGVEATLEHFAAFVDVRGVPRLVGCASLLVNDPRFHAPPGQGRMMQMAVSRQRQREGIGTMLVAALEKRAFGELGLSRIVSSVPKTSAGFLVSLAWAIEGPEYVEAGVPHVMMVLEQPADGV